MRVCVIGAGVIGSLFAGHLAQVAEVSVLTRRRKLADALEARGLRVTGRSDLQASVRASSDPDALPAFDL
ncbi:MAG: 2-dehydropantoate 2-reductase N-terminal domain-containing protein, partial [Gaiellaceae bacterium]